MMILLGALVTLWLPCGLTGPEGIDRILGSRSHRRQSFGNSRYGISSQKQRGGGGFIPTPQPTLNLNSTQKEVK